MSLLSNELLQGCQRSEHRSASVLLANEAPETLFLRCCHDEVRPLFQRRDEAVEAFDAVQEVDEFGGEVLGEIAAEALDHAELDCLAPWTERRALAVLRPEDYRTAGDPRDQEIIGLLQRCPA